VASFFESKPEVLAAGKHRFWRGFAGRDGVGGAAEGRLHVRTAELWIGMGSGADQRRNPLVSLP
jgi:hypothetical protein